MGHIYKTYLSCTEQSSIYGCAKCRTHLTTEDALISKQFQGQHGKAYLFRYVVNIREGTDVDRPMTTGLHTVRDIACEGCREVLGWKYIVAFEESQKYKEGKYILEKKLLLEVEKGSMSVLNAEKTNLPMAEVESEQPRESRVVERRKETREPIRTDNKLVLLNDAIKNIHLSATSINAATATVRKYLDAYIQLEGYDQYEKSQIDMRSSLGEPAHPVEAKKLEAIFLVKATAIVHAAVTEKILNITLPLSEDIYYWDEVLNSGLWTAVYTIQTTPWRIYSLTIATVRSIHDHAHFSKRGNIPADEMKKDWWNTLRTFPRTHLLNLFPQHLRTRLSKRPMLFSNLVTFEVKHNKGRLIAFHQFQAASLGVLVNAAIEVSREEGEDEMLLDVTRCVRVMEGVLRRMNSVNVEQLEDLPELDDLLADAENDAPLDAFYIVSTLREIIDEQLPKYSSQSVQLLRLYGRPSYVTRYWLPCLSFYMASNLVIRYVVSRKQDIRLWIQEAIRTANDFVVHWVYEPMERVWQTIRMKDNDLVLISKESLNSDWESLERMVTQFARDYYHFTDDQIAELSKQVRDGDLSIVLKVYENEIKNPVKNAVMGELVRTLLIQVQKVKVDVDAAMAALNKLLKSNELNFAFLAVAPSMLLLYSIVAWVRNIFQRRSGNIAGKVEEPLLDTLRQIEVILNLANYPVESATSNTLYVPRRTLQYGGQLTYRDQGYLLCDIHVLRVFSRHLSRRNNMRDKFLQDLRELESTKLTVSQKLGTVHRMWRTWFFLNKRRE
ncbi:hypothetical protein BZG36_00236 [Bifiguratus adelaidae]|uniref:Yippee domain-containing protein n=1 Tax=Bifiguratus adelaidae TaxID=1938954 RepID=A0A261Y8D4_9FUNG|nr:hypothetical protein BZG36_00236 [Bifiguratus adelaidae]